MAFFVNVGYQFKLDDSIAPEGAVILCSAMPMHQLERRDLDQYTYVRRRLFDPQLYMAGLEAARSPEHCSKLATYPWFAVSGLAEYDSGKQKMSDWRKKATKDIRSLWPGEAPTDSRSIVSAARECVEFQLRIGTWGIILPGPLTADPMSDYSHELEWLDAGLAHLSTIKDFSHPVFATVAISDVALRCYTEPKKNPLLDVVLDQVSARSVDGVYIVIEQSAERDDTRECSSPRTLRSLLYLVHRFSQESDIQVGVNFIGAFALACEAAGATWWASNWYKSLRRVRLADSLAAGRVYPQFWSAPAALDINLESDFDRLAKAGLSRIADTTPASAGLLQAAQQGVSANSLPAWRYTQSNVKAPIEHYLHSSMQMETAQAAQGAGRPRLDHVESWLASADATATWAISQLGRSLKTKVDHVPYWLEAFHFYRRDHNV